MEHSPFPAWFDKLIAPRLLILGVLVSFVGCCLAGFVVSRQNHFKEFHRFHALIGPESLYYPTVCQVRALAQSRLDPEKIVVLVGGSSVLHGTGQTRDEVWTERLQRQLGDRYQVLNLALRRGRSTELGAVMAEVLACDYPKLLLITDTFPAEMYPDPDGFFHKYLFWDAYYKGLLLPDAAREERLAELIPEAEQRERTLGKEEAGKIGVPADTQRELRTAKILDAALYFSDLWNTLAYTHGHTLWTSMTRDRFLQPRCRFDDPDRGAGPLECRYPRDWNKCLVDKLRGVLKGTCVRDDAGTLAVAHAPEYWSGFERSAATSFPSPTRARTLFVVLSNSPYYVRQLNPDEQTCYSDLRRTTVQHLQSLQFSALEFGADCTPADFGDYGHLAASGGAKLADVVAPQVRALAQRLGYIKQGVGP
jgi:hypothetical protein